MPDLANGLNNDRASIGVSQCKNGKAIRQESDITQGPFPRHALSPLHLQRPPAPSLEKRMFESYAIGALR